MKEEFGDDDGIEEVDPIEKTAKEFFGIDLNNLEEDIVEADPTETSK